MKASHAFGKFALAIVVSISLSLAGFAIPSIGAAAQRPTKDAAGKKGAEAPAAKKAAKGGDKDEEEKPEQVAIQTEDGVQLNAYYFHSKAGKNAPAVILLHGLGEKQSVYYELAFDLQDRGYAVLTLDFRGHGKSTQRAPAVQAQAKPAGPLDFHELKSPTQIAALLNDIEAAKRFLVRRNNAGELNVAKLAVVGSEMGATLGTIWSFKDWQFTSSVAFTSKQGQDVLTMVLISPQYNFKGLPISEELKFLQQRIPIQVIAGKNSKAFTEAERIYKAAIKANPKADWPSELVNVNTKLQGSKLLDPDLEFEVNQSIVKFLDGALKKRPVNWSAREVSESETGP